MKLRLLDYLACPACGGDLALDPACERQGAEIVCGTLRSACGRAFPIRDSIPILLVGNQSLLERKTAASFGYEWNSFPSLFPAYRDNFLEYIRPLGADFFRGKSVLDAGCGNGRHSYWAARFGAPDVIAMDFSDAVFAARHNTKTLDAVHVVQGDIMHPPFKPGIFDFVFSIGVLHHLPDPEGGFSLLTRHVRRGGTFAIWVYGRLHNFSNVHIYETLRLVTRHLPHPFLRYLSHIPAFGVHCLNYVYAALSRVSFGRPLARFVPFSYYARFPFAVKANDAFDVFSAPRSTYWLKPQIEAWYQHTGFASFAVSYLRKKGLKAFGTRP